MPGRYPDTGRCCARSPATCGPNRSPKTIASSLEAARLLAAHVPGRELTALTRADLERFLVEQLSRHRPTTAAVRFRSLQQFYRWAVEEELIETSPMAGMKPPPSRATRWRCWTTRRSAAAIGDEGPEL